MLVVIHEVNIQSVASHADGEHDGTSLAVNSTIKILEVQVGCTNEVHLVIEGIAVEGLQGLQ